MANNYRIIDGEIRLSKNEVNKVVKELRTTIDNPETCYMAIIALGKLSVWNDFLDHLEGKI